MNAMSRWWFRIASLALVGLWACDDGSGAGDASAGELGPSDDMMPPPPDGGDPAPDMDEPNADMAMPCADGETIVCAVEGGDDCAGARICVDGAFGPCEAPAEVCDGVDNDCNGVVDDVAGAGDACAVGVGVCAAAGALACGPDGALACDVEPGEPGVEVCGTGIDEDCDAELDEGGCTCAADRNCGEGALCIDRACVEGACRDDAGCGDGELCMDNGCRPGECSDDEHCMRGHTCVDFFCVGPPPTCAEPQRIERAGLVLGSTAEASSDVGASCGNGAGSSERAFLLDIGVEGPVCLETLGSGYDTVLHVQTRCGEEDTEIACNDDVVPGNLRSMVQLESGAEQVYVLIDGHGGRASGNFVLNITEGECPCVGDANCLEGEICRDGVCGGLVCGDGIRERDEQCDDGGVDPGDGCDGACLLEGGFVCQPRPEDAPDLCLPEGDEICDDGVDNDNDGAADCADGNCRQFPACPCAEDDLFEDASDDFPGPVLPPGRTDGLAHCDSDYYNFTLCPGGTTRVTVEFDHEVADIDVELVNFSIPLLVAQGWSLDDDEVLEYTNDTGAPALMLINLSLGTSRNGYAIDIELFDCEPGAEVCADGDDDDGDGLVDCLDPDCFEHPNCDRALSVACRDARPLPGPGIYVGDTTGGPQVDQESDPDCTAGFVPAGSAEVVYAFSPDAEGAYCLSTLGSTFNTVLYVREDVCDDPGREILCNDNNDAIAGLLRSALNLQVDGESTYFIFVDGFSSNQEGPYQLRVTEGECRLPVEICDNRINDDADRAIDCEDTDCFGSELCRD